MANSHLFAIVALLAVRCTAVMFSPPKASTWPFSDALWHPKKPTSSATQKSEFGQAEYGEVRQTMKNYGDVQYTGDIKMGGQTVKAVIDTGSFELLVFSVNCSLCGTRKHLYDGSKSAHHSTDGFDKMHNYGSGSTDSIESFDDLTIGPMKVSNQVFWEVYDADMPILEDDSFASIFGIGPPASALTFAKDDAREIHEQLEDLKKSGARITDEMKEIVKSYDDAEKHALNSTSVVDNLELSGMSICMGKESNSDGYIVWNDTASSRHPEKFLEIKVVGDTYWSASLSGVKLGASSTGMSEEIIGCKDKCSVIIDSGTSLIAAPPDIVWKVEDIIDDWVFAGGNCDDLSKLPDLVFYLNGNKMTLPPQSYVGVATGFDEWALKKSALVRLPSARRNVQGSLCTSLLMEIDVDTPQGPMWILGMPFFREYYTSFTFRKGHPFRQPASMSFSRATDTCQPGEHPGSKNINLHASTASKRAQLNVDLSKVRVPKHVRGPHLVRNLLGAAKH